MGRTSVTIAGRARAVTVQKKSGESLGAALVARDSFRHGAVFTVVKAGSAITRANVRSGDVVLSINGVDMQNEGYECVLQALKNAGDTFNLEVSTEVVGYPYTRCLKTGVMLVDPHYLVDRVESRLRSLDCVTEKGSIVPVSTRRRGRFECNNRDYIFISRRLYAALKAEHWIGSEYKMNGDYYGALSDLFHVNQLAYTADASTGTGVAAAAATPAAANANAAADADASFPNADPSFPTLSTAPSATSRSAPARFTSAGGRDHVSVAGTSLVAVATKLVSNVMQAIAKTRSSGAAAAPRSIKSLIEKSTGKPVPKDEDFFVHTDDKYRRELLDRDGGYLESTLLFKKAVGALKDEAATDVTVILFKVKGKLGLGVVSPKLTAGASAGSSKQYCGVFVAKLQGTAGKTFLFIDGKKHHSCVGLQIIAIDNESVEFERKEKVIAMLKSSAFKKKTKIKLQVRVNREGFRSCKSADRQAKSSTNRSASNRRSKASTPTRVRSRTATRGPATIVEVMLAPPLGLGIASTHHDGVHIESIKDTGAAKASGIVQVGMKFLSIDGQDVAHKDKAGVIAIMKGLKSAVPFKLSKEGPVVSEEAISAVGEVSEEQEEQSGADGGGGGGGGGGLLAMMRAKGMLATKGVATPAALTADDVADGYVELGEGASPSTPRRRAPRESTVSLAFPDFGGAESSSPSPSPPSSPKVTSPKKVNFAGSKWSIARAGVVEKITIRNKEDQIRKETAFDKLISQTRAAKKKQKKKEQNSVGNDVYGGKSTAFGKLKKMVANKLSDKSDVMGKVLTMQKRKEEKKRAKKIKARGTVKSIKKRRPTTAAPARGSFFGRRSSSNIAADGGRRVSSTGTNDDDDDDDASGGASSQGSDEDDSSSDDDSSDDDDLGGGSGSTAARRRSTVKFGGWGKLRTAVRMGVASHGSGAGEEDGAVHSDDDDDDDAMSEDDIHHVDSSDSEPEAEEEEEPEKEPEKRFSMSPKRFSMSPFKRGASKRRSKAQKRSTPELVEIDDDMKNNSGNAGNDVIDTIDDLHLLVSVADRPEGSVGPMRSATLSSNDYFGEDFNDDDEEMEEEHESKIVRVMMAPPLGLGIRHVENDGVYVDSIKDSGAAKASCHVDVGMKFISIDGHDVTNEDKAGVVAIMKTLKTAVMFTLLIKAHTKVVEVMMAPPLGLGIKSTDNDGVYIDSIRDIGAAKESGIVQVGMKFLSIDGQDVAHKDKAGVIAIMKGLKSSVMFKLSSEENEEVGTPQTKAPIATFRSRMSAV